MLEIPPSLSHHHTAVSLSLSPLQRLFCVSLPAESISFRALIHSSQRPNGHTTHLCPTLSCWFSLTCTLAQPRRGLPPPYSVFSFLHPSLHFPRTHTHAHAHAHNNNNSSIALFFVLFPLTKGHFHMFVLKHTLSLVSLFSLFLPGVSVCC